MNLTSIDRESSAILQISSPSDFDNVYRQYFPRLFSFALKIIGNENHAKDLIQDIFIKIWESPEEIKAKYTEAYLFKTVRNGSLNYIRHLNVEDKLKQISKERLKGEELYYIDMVRDEPTLLIEEELNLEIKRVMEELPSKCQEVFKLSRIEGLKNKEIAEKLDISTKSVEKHISKALKVYRDRFALIPLAIIISIIKNLY